MCWCVELAEPTDWLSTTHPKEQHIRLFKTQKKITLAHTHTPLSGGGGGGDRVLSNDLEWEPIKLQGYFVLCDSVENINIL